MFKIIFGTVLLSSLSCLTTLDTAEAQAIPYSYTAGRNLEAVERRYNTYQEARRRGAPQSEIDAICGPVQSTSMCNTTIGRPRIVEIEQCDSFCCQAGHKTGNCGLAVDRDGQLGQSVPSTFVPGLRGSCMCSNDLRDIRCGLDSRFFGGVINCPFDNSGCWRRCCREGSSGGTCGGFLRLRCICD